MPTRKPEKKVHQRTPVRKRYVTAIGIAVLSALATLLAYEALPATITMHWSASGVANGFAPKWQIFFAPALSAVLTAILWALPYIDPQGRTKRSEAYANLVVAIAFFMLVVQAAILAKNLGSALPMQALISVPLGILFIVMGIYLPRVPRNWFMGIRTPWTLSSDTVWKKTHHLGGRLFIASGVIMLLGIIFPSAALAFILVAAIGTLLTCVAYSYFAWRAEH